MQMQCQEFVGSQPVNTSSTSKIINPDKITAIPSIVPDFPQDPIVSSILNSQTLHDSNTTTSASDPVRREYSITFQINLLADGYGQWRVLFHHGNSDSIRQPACWLNPNSNLLHCRCDSSSTKNDGFDSISQIPLNVWTHVALVYFGPYQFLFLNGKLDKYAKLGNFLKRDDNQKFHLFSTNYGFGRANAQIKNFRMYNVALCESDVLEDMKSDLPITSSKRIGNSMEPKSDSFLRRDLVKLMGMKEFANVHIICSDNSGTSEPLYANDAILASRSQYFQTLLSSKWNQSNVFTPLDPFLLRVEFEYEVMKRILEYIYTGTILEQSGENIPLETLLKLLQVGNQLILTEMEELCTRFIIPKVTLENVCELYSIANDVNVESLSKYCKLYISNNFKVIPTENITSLRLDLLSGVISDLKKRL